MPATQLSAYPQTPRAEPEPAVAAPRFCLHPHGDPARAEVEDLIRRIYAERFGARVTRFAPMLVSLREDEGGQGGGGRIVAAAGYRVATEALFLERYLDRPVDELLAARGGALPPRARIVEVGHLAADRAGEGRRLILQLAQHLATLDIEWVVSTLTGELRQLFSRMGVTPLALGVADPQRLGDAAAGWGSYYDHNPVVLAGSLPLAMRRLPLGRAGAA